MKTSWIRKQNPTTITNGHKTVKNGFNQMECQQCVSLCYSSNTKKNNKWEERSWQWRISDQLQSRLVNQLRAGHTYVPYIGEVSLHTLSVHFLPILPLTPPTPLTQLYFHALTHSILSPLTGYTLSPLTHSNFSPLPAPFPIHSRTY